MDGYGRFSVGSPSSLIAQGKNVVYPQTESGRAGENKSDILGHIIKGDNMFSSLSV